MDLNELDLFYSDITPSRAYVYARLPLPNPEQRWELAGRVRGPFTTRGHTLPSNATFQDLGPPNAIPPASEDSPPSYLLARASVLDPCSWSPDAPNLYDVTVELRLDGQVQASTKRKLGLRNLRAQRDSLFLDAKRFVMRGIQGDAWNYEVRDWLEDAVVRVTNAVDEAWLAQASSEGVITVIRWDGLPEVDIALLRRIAKFASAAMVVLPHDAKLPEGVRHLAPNLLLAQAWQAEQPLAPWAHVAWVEAATREQFAQQIRGLTLPCMVARRAALSSLVAARAACDTLQSDLAPLGQFAGYIV